MRQTLLTLIGAISKAAAVSAVFGGIAFFTKQSVTLWFFSTLVAQFVIFYLYGAYLDYRAAKDITDKNLKELEILSRITFNVPCAACKVTNQVVINANEDTGFVCTSCQAKNSVYVNVEAAVVTEPITLSKTTL